jgi:hypothetical protein
MYDLLKLVCGTLLKPRRRRRRRRGPRRPLRVT